MRMPCGDVWARCVNSWALITPRSATIVSEQFRRLAEMEPEERLFTHPHYWAGFTFTGAWKRRTG